LTSSLLACRYRIESKFRFDPSKGVNPAAIASIDQKYAQQRIPIEKLLGAGPQELRQIDAAINQQRTIITQELIRRTKMLGQAKADAEVANNNQWAVVIIVVLVLGFIVRFGLDRIVQPKNKPTTKQLIESPETDSHADVSRETINKPDSTNSEKPPPQSDKLTPQSPNKQAKTAVNETLLRRGRDHVLAMLGQA